MEVFFLFENKAFFNNFLPIDRSLIHNDFKNFDVNNLEIMLALVFGIFHCFNPL